MDLQCVRSGYKPPERKDFGKREPLLDQPKKLTDAEARSAIQSVSRKHGESMHRRFEDARERLSREYDAYIGLIQAPGGGIKVAARLEFLTTHRTIDEDLDQMVRAAGFSLSLHTRPMTELPQDERYEPIPGRYVEETIPLAPAGDGTAGVWRKRSPVFELRMERRYVITESAYASGDLRKAADSAESLLALVGRLRPSNMPEDLPDLKEADVVPISAARSSKAPPSGPGHAGSDLFGAKAS